MSRFLSSNAMDISRRPNLDPGFNPRSIADYLARYEPENLGEYLAEVRAERLEMRRRTREVMDPEKKLNALLSRAKSRAVEKNLTYDLHRHVPALLARMRRGVCEITGLPFYLGSMSRHPLAASLDRREVLQGYTIENTRIIALAVNRAIGEYGESEILPIMAEWLKSRGYRVESLVSDLI